MSEMISVDRPGLSYSHDERLLSELVIRNVILAHIPPSCAGGGQKMIPVWMLLFEDVGTVESITQHSVSSLALVLDNAVKEHST